MLHREEETVSSVLENGSFYAPHAEPEFDDIPTMRKALSLVIPGMILSILLPKLSEQFVLIPFLASLMLFWGFLPLCTESVWFKICTVLSVVQILWSIWCYLCANVLETAIIPPDVQTVLSYVVYILQLGLWVSLWLGIRHSFPSSAPFILGALVLCTLLIGFVFWERNTFITVVQICAAMVCSALLLVARLKIRK